MKNKDKYIGNVLGIVAEYNPFHNGHKYQLEESKKISKADFVVAIMSGNFTQRGEPAILDKWKRSEIAIENGVDLVIELPLFYVLNGASLFARGAIRGLKNLGCISHLGFGSETEDIETLLKIVELKENESPKFKELIREKLKEGRSYKKAFEESVNTIYGEAYSKALTSNNLLAVEYIYNSIKEEANFEFVPIKRVGQSHNKAFGLKNLKDNVCINNCMLEENKNLSGQSIRKKIKKMIQSNGVEELKSSTDLGIPEITRNIIFENLEELWLDDYYRINNLVRYFALCQSREYWINRGSWEVGMESKFLKEARYKRQEDIIESLTSKRYSRSRIKKYLMQVLMDIKKDQEPSGYIRVLGFNKKGSDLLRLIRKYELNSWEIVNNVNKSSKDLSLDIKGTDFYNLIMKRDTYQNSDFVKAPYISKD